MSSELSGSKEETLVVGIGNVIMGDEGFGVQVARRLKDRDVPENVRIVEGGVGGFNLLGTLEGADRIVVVDVMMADIEPGEVYLFKPGSDFSESGKSIVSFHQVGVLELMQMRNLLGHQAEVFFLVTRPEKLEWGTELSAPVREAIDKAVDLLEELCCNDFAGLERSKS